ncbi:MULTISPECIES: GNAT family N-acetyltransferase [Marinococcus]|jgi:GNAT superfamily N-acetyltransferase|uniref:Acetyltransferase (GNAT) family protein n=1 Tax=Marinococcus luteus TaxID=1122204 RepID=A0A1H2VDE9_9BACI|nr:MULTISPECIES: GNAT family N-acetyltransferase [Marinococcus]MDZ5783662.1 GNAT family N-acetyltransferase [Marinococcus luteus]SDW66381.1 Acetyltransferase (GNAT) family protein [Marinococcus luteus]
MQVYKVPTDTEQYVRNQIADLLMGQMDSIGMKDAYRFLQRAIDLSLDSDSTAHIFVAETEEQIVGAAFLNIGISLEKGGYYVWLNDLYVDQQYRNRGIAKKLLLKIIYWAEHNDIKGIELETGVNNAATKALYNSLGFYDVISKRYGFRF